MTKFIELADQNGQLYFINVAHIVYVYEEHIKDKVVLSILDSSGSQFTIQTEKSYEEIKKLIME